MFCWFLSMLHFVITTTVMITTNAAVISGSTDAVVFTTTGNNDPVTSAFLIIIGGLFTDVNYPCACLIVCCFSFVHHPLPSLYIFNAS